MSATANTAEQTSLSQQLGKHCSNSLTSKITHCEYPARELLAVDRVPVDTRKPTLCSWGLRPLKIRGDDGFKGGRLLATRGLCFVASVHDAVTSRLNRTWCLIFAFRSERALVRYAICPACSGCLSGLRFGEAFQMQAFFVELPLGNATFQVE